MPSNDSAQSNSANGAMLSPTPSAIEIIGGTFVDLLRPEPGQLTLRAIANGMAKSCRYIGQIETPFYSVAEHAVLVHDLLRWRGAPPGILRAALFHDAAEGLLHDLVAPLKWSLRYQEIDSDAHYMGGWPPDPSGHRSAYDVLTERMEEAICEAFDVRMSDLARGDIRVADMWALKIEARALTTSGGAHWRWPGELPEGGELPARVTWAGNLGPDEARVLWLDRVGAPVDDYEVRDGRV
jgi:hypothetical protein